MLGPSPPSRRGPAPGSAASSDSSCFPPEPSSSFLSSVPPRGRLPQILLLPWRSAGQTKHIMCWLCVAFQKSRLNLYSVLSGCPLILIISISLIYTRHLGLRSWGWWNLRNSFHHALSFLQSDNWFSQPELCNHCSLKSAHCRANQVSENCVTKARSTCAIYRHNRVCCSG